MSSLRILTEEELAATLATGEFPESVRRAAERVVVLMTQDWCPQWHDMARWLGDFADRAAIFVLVYNTRPDFETIRSFKEEVFGNFEIPYLRTYKDGALIAETNWLPKNTFAALLTRDKPFKL